MDSIHHFAIVSRIFFLNRLSSFLFNIVPDTIHGHMSASMPDACVKLLSFFHIRPFLLLDVLLILLSVLSVDERRWLRRISKCAVLELLLDFHR